jgi:hypothetical protein
MALKLRAKKVAIALELGRDIAKEESLAILEYDENLTEQEISVLMAEKEDAEVILAMKVGDENFGSGEKIIEKMFSLKVDMQRILSNLKRLRAKHRFPVSEAVVGGHWEIVRRIYDRRLLHVNFSSTW